MTNWKLTKAEIWQATESASLGVTDWLPTQADDAIALAAQRKVMKIINGSGLHSFPIGKRLSFCIDEEWWQGLCHELGVKDDVD